MTSFYDRVVGIINLNSVGLRINACFSLLKMGMV